MKRSESSFVRKEKAGSSDSNNDKFTPIKYNRSDNFKEKAQ
jgi:hypothetical protein